MRLISSRHRPWVVYAAISLLSLGIMTSNLRGGVVSDHIESTVLHLLTPVYATVDWFVDRCQSVWSGYIHLMNLQTENTHLKETLKVLQEQHLLLADRAESTERLEFFVGMSLQTPQANVRAKVIRRGNSLLNPTVLIDTGSYHGIREGFGVAGADGALGQIVRVGPGISKVLTLHHPDAGIGAMLQTSRVQGVVSGTGKDTCMMRFVSRFDPVILGEKVVTSGLDGAFPKGVPIGRVTGIRRDTNEIFQTLDISTDVNINAIEEVIIFIMPELPSFEFSDFHEADPVKIDPTPADDRKREAEVEHHP
jgi:rod shape-determining protein MreC